MSETKGNARGSGYVRASDDFYREPRWAVDALLDVERFDGIVWDPACGSGNIDGLTYADAIRRLKR
jgi:hypothetical protein